jgi:hypothetical protein
MYMANRALKTKSRKVRKHLEYYDDDDSFDVKDG